MDRLTKDLSPKVKGDLPSLKHQRRGKEDGIHTETLIISGSLPWLHVRITLAITLKIPMLGLMPKTWPLWTSAESNLGDRVLGEVENNSFIALPGKGGRSGLLPPKNCMSQPRGI